MIDENLTQQHIGPKTLFEIVAAAIKEAEKMLRETKDVHEFYVRFERSKGLSSLSPKSQRSVPNDVISWRPNEYEKAKLAIEPFGSGLGKDAIKHFLPKGSIPSDGTLQATITAYYQEEWRKEGERLLEQSRLKRWKGQEANDAERIAAALE